MTYRIPLSLGRQCPLDRRPRRAERRGDLVYSDPASREQLRMLALLHGELGEQVALHRCALRPWRTRISPWVVLVSIASVSETRPMPSASKRSPNSTKCFIPRLNRLNE